MRGKQKTKGRKIQPSLDMALKVADMKELILETQRGQPVRPMTQTEQAAMGQSYVNYPLPPLQNPQHPCRSHMRFCFKIYM